MINIFYYVTLVLLTILSWGFVDANSPFRTLPFLHHLVYQDRLPASLIYVGILGLLFIIYFWILREIVQRKMTRSKLVTLLAIAIVVLFVSFPAFSNDIFNYIATAKVTYLYRENPYLVMPIEIVNEPMLTFLHAANKVALYGPVWILLSGLAHYLGLGYLFLTLFTFKALILVFYLGLVWVIWKITNNLWSVALFAFNPLVLIDTLVDGHNDVVMMFLALASFYLLKRKKRGLAFLSLFLSFFIKGATVFLLPVFIYTAREINRKKNVDWQRVWLWSIYSMYLIFFLSPLREEMYSWYFIWILPFVAVRRSFDILTAISIGFSFGLPLRFLPFIYWREWGGTTPFIKKIVTFLPPALSGITYAIRKKI